MFVEKHVLILATTNDFLLKFEQDNVALLQAMGYTVHYAANLREPAYLSDRERIRARGVVPHHIDIARSPYLLGDNRRALRQVLCLLRRWEMGAIHCHTPVGGLVGRLAGRLAPTRPVVVYTAHGFHFYRGAPLYNQLAFYPVEWNLARYTDILVTINSEDYRAARRLPLRRGGKVFQLPGGGAGQAGVFPPAAGGAGHPAAAAGGGPRGVFPPLRGGAEPEQEPPGGAGGPLPPKAPGLPEGHPLRASAGRDSPAPSWRRKSARGGSPRWSRCTATGRISPRWWAAPTPRCSPPAGRGWAWRGWNPWPWGCRCWPPTTGAPGSICPLGRTACSTPGTTRRALPGASPCAGDGPPPAGAALPAVRGLGGAL